ncbi:MAG TPA: hypothetical protein VNZ05_00505, partial [Solirubrobacteraceae bacterium]|nr:hypothetical protein [Solirubrobacteraceae bacterium]
MALLASSLVALLAPAVASAHHRHHARGHRHHASSARLLNFGAAITSPTTGTAPVQSSPTNETAGTVESFSGGVLKLKLNDGSEVSGKVTDETELRCEPATRA